MMTIETKTHHVTGINVRVLNETVQARQTDPDLDKCRFGARNTWIDANHNWRSISARHDIENRREVIREVNEDLKESTKKYNNETGPQCLFAKRIN